MNIDEVWWCRGTTWSRCINLLLIQTLFFIEFRTTFSLMIVLTDTCKWSHGCVKVKHNFVMIESLEKFGTPWDHFQWPNQPTIDTNLVLYWVCNNFLIGWLLGNGPVEGALAKTQRHRKRLKCDAALWPNTLTIEQLARQKAGPAQKARPAQKACPSKFSVEFVSWEPGRFESQAGRSIAKQQASQVHTLLSSSFESNWRQVIFRNQPTIGDTNISIHAPANPLTRPGIQTPNPWNDSIGAAPSNLVSWLICCDKTVESETPPWAMTLEEETSIQMQAKEIEELKKKKERYKICSAFMGG